jgi:TPP-dependent pyruvate/acetoin dehydrogenase alpha subunit
LAAVEAEVDQQIDEAVRFALDSPMPTVDGSVDDVYTAILV